MITKNSWKRQKGTASHHPVHRAHLRGQVFLEAKNTMTRMMICCLQLRRRLLQRHRPRRHQQKITAQVRIDNGNAASLVTRWLFCQCLLPARAELVSLQTSSMIIFLRTRTDISMRIVTSWARIFSPAARNDDPYPDFGQVSNARGMCFWQHCMWHSRKKHTISCVSGACISVFIFCKYEFWFSGSFHCDLQVRFRATYAWKKKNTRMDNIRGSPCIYFLLYHRLIMSILAE